MITAQRLTADIELVANQINYYRVYVLTAKIDINRSDRSDQAV